MKKAILCVDDEKIILEILQRQLMNTFGGEFVCEIAEDVNEAWEVITELTQDGYELSVVITDWLMPGTKGDEFLVELHKVYPKTVKIMVSGQSDETAVANAQKNSNLCAYISKPWDYKLLINTIKTALSTI